MVKIIPSSETHKSQFQALDKYFKTQYGIAIDSLCKDLARAMLISYDLEIYCNPHAKVFEEMYVEKPYQSKPLFGSVFVQGATVSCPDESIVLIERLIVALEERHMDITSSYTDWIKVGFALCTTFGEQGRGYYHRLGRMYPHYSPVETDRTYTQLLAKNNGKTKLGTILYFAKKAGVRL